MQLLQLRLLSLHTLIASIPLIKARFSSWIILRHHGSLLIVKPACKCQIAASLGFLGIEEMKWFVCICWVSGIFVTSLLRQRGQLLLLEGVVGTLRFECDNHRLVIST